MTPPASLTRRRFFPAAGAALTGLATPGLLRSAEKKPIARAVTRGPKHHYFGYYDKTPWDKTGRYLLAMEIGFCDRNPKPGEALTVGMVDLADGDRYRPFDKTLAWSWQQGTMLQWLGSPPDREVVYNSVHDSKYVATVRDVHKNKTRQLPLPIYAVSADGKQAVSLDFARLNRLRPGYGYLALPEEHKDDPAPKKSGIFHMDVATGKHDLIVPLAWAAAHKPDDSFRGAHHWFNHLVFNPSGTRFIFLHRWGKPGGRRRTRMYTARPDGSDVRLAWDTGMVSHFDWQDDRRILAWTRLDGKDGFYVYDLRTGERKPFARGVVTRDGHCSYSPDRAWVLNDTYPDRERMQTLMLIRVKDQKRFDLGKFYLPPKLKGPFRCDLHPRWSRDGRQVCIDSAHEPTRQVYVIDVAHLTKG
jgi:hypothetical protein